MSRLIRRPFSISVIGLATLTLAGCASASASPVASQTPNSSVSETAEHANGYPLTIDNCGTTITVEKVPQRVITVKSSTLELLLSLGLEDHVIGTAYSDGPLPDSLAAAGADLPVLAEKVPSQEVTLAANPDFIFAGWESNFSSEGVGEREALTKLGVTSYVAPAACQEPGYAPHPLSFSDVFAGFAQAGEIFDVPAAAAALVASEKAKLEAIVPLDEKLTAVWYSSGKDKPFAGGGTGAPELIMSSAGLVNSFADVSESWTSTSWEAVAAADPDVLVLVDAAWNTAEAKIQLIEANPVLANLTAVKNKAYVIVPFPATEAGVRTVDAVADVVAQLSR